MNNVEMKNPRTWDASQYVDVDMRIEEEDEEGNQYWGEWMPHTILSNDERYEDIINGSLGGVEIQSPPRDVSGKLQEVLAQGVEWMDGNGVSYFLKANDADARERISSAAIRLQINNTLPKNKSVFEYPDINDNLVSLPKDNVQDVAMLIQDFVEDCYDNYNRLLSDPTLDIESGWPE